MGLLWKIIVTREGAAAVAGDSVMRRPPTVVWIGSISVCPKTKTAQSERPVLFAINNLVMKPLKRERFYGSVRDGSLLWRLARAAQVTRAARTQAKTESEFRFGGSEGSKSKDLRRFERK
ncbi:hypothetical protein SBA4_40006 [Candidatus Sulfopaludibacter sp. SbA4]|nr:hypothetical protein SBA4_40006 [Candidatus Sulfopaludibacter sp. SbA4]